MPFNSLNSAKAANLGSLEARPWPDLSDCATLVDNSTLVNKFGLASWPYVHYAMKQFPLSLCSQVAPFDMHPWIVRPSKIHIAEAIKVQPIHSFSTILLAIMAVKCVMGPGDHSGCRNVLAGITLRRIAS